MIGSRTVQGAGRNRRYIRSLIGNLIWYIVLSFFALVLALPLVWLISTSFKSGAQTFLMPPQWIPNPLVFENYPDAFRAVPFHKYFWNTLRVVFGATLGTLVSGSLAAFAFARLRFRAYSALRFGPFYNHVAEHRDLDPNLYCLPQSGLDQPLFCR